MVKHMKYNDLVVLLPCQSLESLSLECDAAEAEELLSGWSALYHPALVGVARTAPRWLPADSPPEEVAGGLFVVPSVSAPVLPEGWLARAEAAGATVLHGYRDRRSLVAAVLQGLSEIPPVNPALAAEFLALGYCHLQVELLTRQLRYMSNLDEVRFRESLVAAAEVAVAGDEAGAREHLRAAFDRLVEAREYFYPVETYLLDLTLLAETTLGPSLRHELSGSKPLGILVCGELLRRLAHTEPQSLAALKLAIEEGRACIIGGEFCELELPLLTPEEILYQFRKGLAAYQDVLGCRPTIFGRRRFGLTPLLPQILRKLGFEGALHFTLDEGRIPAESQSKIRWEGVDGTEIEALARLPVDAASPEVFLRLAQRLGNSMDLDHAATAVFAHWPAQICPWYGDVRRMSDYGPALGKMTTLATYFENTQYAGRTSKYSPDKYRSPYLKQDVEAGRSDPIARWVDHHRRIAAIQALAGLRLLALGVQPRPLSPVAAGCTVGQAAARTIEDAGGQVSVPAGPEDVAERPDGVEPPKGIQPDLPQAADVPSAQAAPVGAAWEQPLGPLDEGLLEHPEALAEQAARELATLAGAMTSGRPDSTSGCLLVNPWSFARRVWVDVSDWPQTPAVIPPVRLVCQGENVRAALVEVPAMGYAWIGPGPAPSPRADGKPAKPLAEDCRLHNEFFQLTVHPQTGAIQAITNYAVRGNRLGHRLAYRFGRQPEVEPGSEEEYSETVADEIIAENPDDATGRITVRGRLLGRQGQRLAGFVETFEARRGSRVLGVSVELDVAHMPSGAPWQSYYAARFAWSDETANTYRGVGLTSQPTDAAMIEAPHYFDIRAPRTRLTLLTGGLPYHRRYGIRKLDTLLVVAGESARSFRFGIGVDLTHPVRAALEFLSPELPRQEGVPRPASQAAWLFHLDARNVLATHWEPLTRGGQIAGYRVRLLETEGREALLGIRSYRPVARAQRVNFLGEDPVELPVADDRVQCEVRPYQWLQVEVEFAE